MKPIVFDYSKALSFFELHELAYLKDASQFALQQLMEGQGAGAEYTDWLHWPNQFNQSELKRIKACAEKIQSDSQVLVVIGIGGSYLGAKAAIDFLGHSFFNQVAVKEGKTQIYFAGQHLSASYLNDLLEVIGNQDFSINVISKSGTTTEPAIAFRVLKEKLIAKYGEEEAGHRIYVTTDQKNGALKKEALAKKYESFVIPNGIGGRFTVLTAVGLLPIAVSGANIDDLLAGASAGSQYYQESTLEENPAMQYALIRNILYRKGKDIEILVNFEPHLNAFGEWWKQLFGESEGKDHKGIFPCTAHFSTDLHSMGQIIQEGKRNLFETVLYIEDMRKDLSIPQLNDDQDGLGYIEGEKLSTVNFTAHQGTLLAHTDGQVPNLLLRLPQRNEYYFGQMVYFFEMAVAISGYLNGVNPFDQPGVEAYKKNMFALLGKPGYEQLRRELKERL